MPIKVFRDSTVTFKKESRLRSSVGVLLCPLSQKTQHTLRTQKRGAIFATIARRKVSSWFRASEA
eukprot:3251212-Amphidinium_carterae.1